MSMFGKFSEKSQKAILFAQQEAREQRHSYIGSEHILLGIIGKELTQVLTSYQGLA